MKILAISDCQSPDIWEKPDECGANDADIIVSCGDLNTAYLEFVRERLNKPLYYVRGNHDKNVKYVKDAVHLDSRIVNVQGVRFLGFDSVSRDGKLLTDEDVTVRVEIMKRIIDRDGGFDVLVTHHPMLGFGDGDNELHKGYKAYVKLVEEYKPKIMLHGHIHLDFYKQHIRCMQYASTRIINAYKHTILEI